MTKINRPEVDDRILALDDEKKRVIDFWDTNIPIPEAGIFDEPTRCYEINLEWATIVMGLVSWLTEIAAWKDAQNEDFEAIQQISDFLVGMDCTSMIDCGDVVDCIEVDPNYIALQSAIFSQADLATLEHINELSDDYDSTPQSVGASIPVAAPDEDESNALCWTIENFVEAYCAVKTAKIEQKNVVQIAWSRVQSAMRKLYDGVTAWLGFTFGADLFACVVSDAAALAALADTDAIAEVACYLTDYLSPLVMIEVNFHDAIVDAAAALSGNAQIIACLMDGDNSLDMYVQFLEWYNIAIERQAAGDSLICNCGVEWCYSLPLTDFVNFDASGATGGVQNIGQVSGSNLVATDDLFVGGFTNRGIAMEYEFGETLNVSGANVIWEGSAVKGFGTLGSDVYVARVQLLNGGSVVHDTGVNSNPDFDDTIYQWSGITETFTKIRFWCIVSRATGGSVGGSQTTTAIKFTGAGTNPFGEDNC